MNTAKTLLSWPLGRVVFRGAMVSPTLSETDPRLALINGRHDALVTRT